MENQYLFWYLFFVSSMFLYSIGRGFYDSGYEKGIVMSRLHITPERRIITDRRDFKRYVCRREISRFLYHKVDGEDIDAMIKDDILRNISEGIRPFVWWRKNMNHEYNEMYIEGNILVAKGY